MGDKGKSGPAAEHNWSDTASEDQPDSPARTRQSDHEYHEISDEDEPLPKVEVRKVCFVDLSFVSRFYVMISLISFY